MRKLSERPDRAAELAATIAAPVAIWGHFTVVCRVPGCRSVWYDPPHEP